MPQIYETYGPFPLEGKKADFRGRPSSDFWREVEALHPNLSLAIGVYVIAARSSDGVSLPWYVGMTQEGFEKRLHSQSVTFLLLTKKSGATQPELFFVARRTIKREGFVKPGKRPGVKALETRLIETCLKRNPDLHNDRTARGFKDTVVPGYMNDKGKRSAAATSLNALITGTGAKS